MDHLVRGSSSLPGRTGGAPAPGGFLPCPLGSRLVRRWRRGNGRGHGFPSLVGAACGRIVAPVRTERGAWSEEAITSRASATGSRPESVTSSLGANPPFTRERWSPHRWCLGRLSIFGPHGTPNCATDSSSPLPPLRARSSSSASPSPATPSGAKGLRPGLRVWGRGGYAGTCWSGQAPVRTRWREHEAGPAGGRSKRPPASAAHPSAVLRNAVACGQRRDATVATNASSDVSRSSTLPDEPARHGHIGRV